MGIDPFSAIDVPLFDKTEILDPIVGPGGMVPVAQAYASEVQRLAAEAAEQLVNATNSAGDDALDNDSFVTIIDTLFDVDDAGLDGIEISEPEWSGVTVPVITEPTTLIPTVPEMDDTDLEVIGDIPAYDVNKPSINIPDLPDDDFPTFTETAPVPSENNLPTEPSFTLPTIPVIGDVSIPSLPDYNIPSFEGSMPVMDLRAPDTLFVYNEAEYDSDLKNKLATELYEQIVAGGTGLNKDAEQAIWDRATARQEEENVKALQAAHEYHSSRGFNLPEGVLVGTVLEEYNRANQRKDDLNNDIIKLQAELAQTNTHFIITQAIQFEKNLMDNVNAVKDRAFEAAKATVQLANEIYRIKTEEFVARLEGYKVQATVYEVRIRAEIAKAEFYKAQIEGIKAGVEVKSLLVAAYNSQIEGIKALIQMYGAQMEAAKIKADIDRIGLDTYKIKAEVFGIKTDAMTSRYNAYAARIAGEAEKVKMYLGETQAYTAKIEGFKAVADVVSTKAQIRLAKHQGDVETFKGYVELYTAETAKIMAKAETEIKAEGLKVDTYKAETDKYAADLDAVVKNYLGRVEAAKSEADVLIKEREVAIQRLLGEKGLATDILNSNAKIAGQLAAAALTSISASLSMGMSQGQSQSLSMSRDLTYEDTHAFDGPSSSAGG